MAAMNGLDIFCRDGVSSYSAHIFELPHEISEVIQVLVLLVLHLLKLALQHSDSGHAQPR